MTFITKSREEIDEKYPILDYFAQNINQENINSVLKEIIKNVNISEITVLLNLLEE
jgi:hypothetical protein